jgi:hypothetical protein
MENVLIIIKWLSIVAIVGYLVAVFAYRIWEAKWNGIHWIEDDPEDKRYDPK